MQSMRKFRKLGLLLVLVIVFSIMSAGMAYAIVGSTDYRFPGTGSQEINFDSEVGSTGWGDEGRIVSADGSAAQNSVYGGTPTYYLRGSNFGFNESMIPNEAVITGIEVVIGRADSPYSGGGTAAIQDFTVKLVNAAGTKVGENKAQTGTNWPDIEGYTIESGDFIPATYGGPGDLWGLGSWNVSDILDPDFGVVLSAINMSPDLSSAWVDYMKIKVYYTVEGVATPALSVTNSPVTYNGSPQAAAVSGSVAGVVSDIKYDESSTVPTSAGTYAVTADFTPTDTTNYASLDDASAGSFVINQAVPVLSVTNSPVTYNGLQQAAEVSGSVAGVVSDIKYEGSSTVPTAAGTYAVTADFTPTDTTNYASLDDASAGNFVINQAAPVLSVTNSPVTYNGSPQAAAVSGSVDGVASDVKYNGSYTVPADAGTYEVTGDFTPTDTVNYTSLEDASAGTFTINQLTVTHTVTVTVADDSTAGGWVSGEGIFEEGDIVTVTATVNAGYSFVNWTENDAEVSTSAVYEFIMGTADRTLVAHFALIPTYNVSVSASPAEGGSVSGGGSYAKGARVTVTATANPGYSFVNWTEGSNTVSTKATYRFTMGTADSNLVANFTLIPTHSISVSASPAEGGSVSGGGSYAKGARVTVTAAANPGYSFVNWTEGPDAVSTKATYKFTMGTADRTLTANFQAVAPSWPNGIRLSAAAVTSNSVTLTLNQPVPGAVEYIVYYGGLSKTFSASDGTTLLIDGLSPSTSYTFAVQARYTGDIETTNGPSKKVRTK